MTGSVAVRDEEMIDRNVRTLYVQQIFAAQLDTQNYHEPFHSVKVHNFERDVTHNFEHRYELLTEVGLKLAVPKSNSFSVYGLASGVDVFVHVGESGHGTLSRESTRPAQSESFDVLGVRESGLYAASTLRRDKTSEIQDGEQRLSGFLSRARPKELNYLPRLTGPSAAAAYKRAGKQANKEINTRTHTNAWLYGTPSALEGPCITYFEFLLIWNAFRTFSITKSST